ncbi:reverse transcriptase [Tanacetum coccineum]
MASDGSDQDARYALSKLLQMGTVAEYESEFVVSLLTSFYISGLKLTLQIDLLRARPKTLGEAFALARITEARFEDERATIVIAKPNDLNIAVQVQDKILRKQLSIRQTRQEQECQDGLKPVTTGSWKKGDLCAITSKGGPPDHMRASEKELVVLKSPLEQKSMFRRQERMLRRQEQQRLAKDAKIQIRIWDHGIKRQDSRVVSQQVWLLPMKNKGVKYGFCMVAIHMKNRSVKMVLKPVTTDSWKKDESLRYYLHRWNKEIHTIFVFWNVYDNDVSYPIQLAATEAPPPIKSLFEQYSDNNGIMTVDHLQRFLVEVQKQEKASVEVAQAIMNTTAHLFHRKGFNLETFFKYLFGESNPALEDRVSQEVLVDIPENLVEKYNIVAEHGLSSENTQSPGGSSDTSEGSKTSVSFEDYRRSDED